MADFPLQQLRALLSPAPRTAGVVTRVKSATLVEVATADGLILVQPGAAVQPGQSVTLRNGMAWPRAAATRVYGV